MVAIVDTCQPCQAHAALSVSGTCSGHVLSGFIDLVVAAGRVGRSRPCPAVGAVRVACGRSVRVLRRTRLPGRPLGLAERCPHGRGGRRWGCASRSRSGAGSLGVTGAHAPALDASVQVTSMLKTTTCTTGAVHIAPGHRASPMGALLRADNWQMTPRTRYSATCTTPQEMRCTTGLKGPPCNVAPHLLDPKRTVVVVVPPVEAGAELSGVLDRTEGGREVGPVLQGLEPRLGVGVE